MSSQLIHIATAILPKRGKSLLLLRKEGDRDYTWFIDGAVEERSDVKGMTVEEAMRAAYCRFRLNSFKTVACGFRYTLPERDEHGMNALFHQMKASYSSINGVYYDEELGHNCFVQNASDEAIALWKKLKGENRL